MMALAKLSNEQRRALRVLARHPTACAEATLLAYGFSLDLLGALVFAGLAAMQQNLTGLSGQKRIVVWVQITERGITAIAIGFLDSGLED
jgi:hypothetical protein